MSQARYGAPGFDRGAKYDYSVKIAAVIAMKIVLMGAIGAVVGAAIMVFVTFRTGAEEWRRDTTCQQDETERKTDYQACYLFHVCFLCLKAVHLLHAVIRAYAFCALQTAFQHRS